MFFVNNKIETLWCYKYTILNSLEIFFNGVQTFQPIDSNPLEVRMALKNTKMLYGEDMPNIIETLVTHKRNRKTMNRNWSYEKANPALKTKTGNK